MNKKIEWTRTHYCGDLRIENVDQDVVLMGWCQTRRDHGGVIFVDLRDYTGISQIVFKMEISETSHVLADSIRGEFVLAKTNSPRIESAKTCDVSLISILNTIWLIPV